MKNNKGFTLVEVLAVIAILVTIIVIVTPKVFKQFKTAEDVTDKEQINTLINTAKLYMNQNSNLLPQENDIYVIQMQELKDSGLIKTNQILNPSTKEELNGCIIVKYENNKYKYEYKEELEQITVTFDPQGGTLQETSKNVITGEKYGTLPTPTKEGYTFMGWRGKNMLNPNNEYSKNSAGTIDRSKVTYDSDTGIYTANGWQATHHLHGYDVISELTTNKSYTFSAKIEDTGTENKAWIGFGLLTNDTRNYKYSQPEIEIGKRISYTLYELPENTTICIVGLLNSTRGTGLKYSKLQLEEGETATEYEPYQEYNSSTTVTKEDNHTLYAIWQANS